ncbi:MAG: hypothetical protein QG657_3607, partial [Acidobacteriota bacterium]|nr:hypothetical protein [Acidobacteriota bacterium]
LPDVHGNREIAQEYTSPSSETEKRLAEIWENILGVNIGTNEEFFHSGGDSIKAVRLINLINTQFSAHLKIADIYLNGTIKKLAAVIESEKTVPGYANDEVERALKEIEELKNRVTADERLPKEIEDVYPMSDIQKGMVFHSLKDMQTALYHDQMVYQARISGFNAALFKKAFILSVEKHAILRTVFDLDTYSEPVQLVYRCVPNDITHDDISAMEKGRQEEYLTRFLEEDRKNAFQFGIPPLWRLRTFALGNDNICVLLVAHHAILDGWSVASLVTETINTYWRLKDNHNFVPVMLKNSYKAFVIDQMVEKNRVDSVVFWRRELDGFKRLEFSIPQLGNVGKNEIKKYNYNLGVDLFSKLKEISKIYQTNIKHLCFAAYLYMLNMYCYENEMVVGLVTNNRPVCKDGDKILGCFLNTIPVRLKIPTHISWRDYINLVEKKLLELKPYERLPLFDIVRVIGENTQDRNPIFDVIFNFVDFHVLGQIEQDYGKDDADKLNVEGNILTNTLFNFNVSTTLEDFGVFISFSEAHLRDETAKSLCCYFERVLKKFIIEPRSLANKFELIPVEERKTLLEEFNDTNTEYPSDKSVHELFEEQVERTPNSIALVGANRHPRVCPDCLTYSELNKQSDRLAHSLIEKGVLADNIVGIMMERSIEMMVGIYGILKSGGAYLPIDPSYPQERIQYMLEDSNARGLLGMEECQNKIIVNCQLLLVNCKLKNVRSLQAPYHQSSFINHHSNQLAYIIYTSGSTGKPKGVMIEHRSVVNLLFALQNNYPFTTADTYLLKTSHIFDVSVTELFGWAMGGGRLAILEKGGEKDPDVIFDWIERCQVTHINFVPSMFNEFIEHAAGEDKNRLSSVKYIFLAGEVLLPRMVERFRALNIPGKLENIYGPTESTVYASKYSLSGWDGNGSIPIGKPLPNISLYIINKGGQWQPLGAAGELCIAGVGLARGYLNNPELTKQKFLEVQESFFKKVPGLFYRTGDLARWLPNGAIEFLGRIDHQVKIRGYRIELGEIENHLSKYKRIKEAVVVVKEAESGDKNLAAYIVSDVEIPTATLRDYLTNLLPGYMIPAYFVRVEKMPLTSSGKIDRGALPEPILITGKEYKAPRNEIEKKLVELWSEILARNLLHTSQLQTSIGIDDNFFQLGGHSLKVTSLASRIYKVFGVKVPLGEIFKKPTIRGLFDYIDRTEREQYIWIEPTETKAYYELSPMQNALFTLQQLHRDSTFYNIPFITRLDRDLGKGKLEQVFHQIIKRHESLRTSFEIIDEIPVQRIHIDIPFELKHMELVGDGIPNQLAVENIINSVIRPFDLSRPPLFRACLITAADLHLLVVDMHHIISDGISNMILEKEFRVLCGGEELAPIRLQYKDYVGWRNGKTMQLKLKQQEMYWLAEFSQEPPELNLPTNYPRPAERNFEGNTVGFALSTPEILLLNEIARDTESTLFVVMLCLFAILLSRLSGQDDIVIGVPVSGRPHPNFECIIGVFINTIPIRLSIDDTQTVINFLAYVKQKCFRAFENQDYPFEELVEKAALQRETSRNPLFDTMLNYMNYTESIASVSDHFSKDHYTYQRGTSKFDFSVDIHQYRDSMYLSFEYSTQLFKVDTIERFLDCFKQIVSTILNNREVKLEDIKVSHDYSELENNVFSTAPVDFDSMFSRKEEKRITIGV